MPRDGSNQYYQPFPPVEADRTIESAVYNGFVGDVAHDLNHPRPIVAGGTGATNVDDALLALKAEKADQIVSNFDSHLWLPGSFSSAGTASGSPVSGHIFQGQVTISADGTHATVLARDLSDTVVPGTSYVREKKAGVWSAWVAETATLEAKKVNRAGDTMTGGLTMSFVSPNITLNKAGDSQHNQLYGSLNGVSRWLVSIGDAVAEGAGNVGSNFAIHRYANDGTYLGQPFSIERASGTVTAAGALNGNTVGAAGAMSAGGAFTAGGEITGGGNVRAGGSLIANSAHVFFNAGATWYIRCDGANFHSPWGYLWHSGNFTPAAYQPALGFTPVRQSGGAYQQGNTVYIGWDGVGLRAQVDGLDLTRFLFEGQGGGYTSARWVHIADYTHISNAGLVEPHGGCAITGVNIFPALNCTARYRQLQMYSSATGWVQVGYA